MSTFSSERYYAATRKSHTCEFCYKMVDETGNVLVWKSSKWIEKPEEVKMVTGTVKAHSEFNMIQQTELIRGKVA